MLVKTDAKISLLTGGAGPSDDGDGLVVELRSLAGMLEDLKLVRVCDGCGASAQDEGVRLRVCTRCRQAFFCSQACLERSYERHKPDCTRLRAQGKARERAEAKGKEAQQGEEREEAEAEQEETQQRCDNGGGDDAGPSTE